MCYRNRLTRPVQKRCWLPLVLVAIWTLPIAAEPARSSAPIDPPSASTTTSSFAARLVVDLTRGPNGSPTPQPVAHQVFGVNRHWGGYFNGFHPVSTDDDRYLDGSDSVVDLDGYRDGLAVLDQLTGHLDDLGVRAFRYPGGLQANTFNWQKSVQAWEDRPALKSPPLPFYIDETSQVADRWILYGLNEFLCEVERSQDVGAELPVTLTLPAVPSLLLGFPAEIFMMGVECGPTLTCPRTLPQLAADLYEFLWAPDDPTFNPSPTELPPDDPTNIRWAQFRRCPVAGTSPDQEGIVTTPHPEPFRVRSLEIGNETRVPGLGDLYAVNSLMPIANALHDMRRRLLPVVPDAALEIGVVSLDSYTFTPANWREWNREVWESTHDADGWLCDDAYGGGEARPCFHAWSMHHYTPGASAFGGVAFRQPEDVLEVTRRLPAGTYHFELTAARKNLTPQLVLQVDVEGTPTIDPEEADFFDLDSGDPRRFSTSGFTTTSPTITLAAPATVTLRLRALGIPAGDPVNGTVFVYPLVGALRADTEPGEEQPRAEYFDLRTARPMHLLAMSAPAHFEAVLDNHENNLHREALDIWLTEHHPRVVVNRNRLPVPATWQDAMTLGLTYRMLLESGVSKAHVWEAFEEASNGLIEGVATDVFETGDQRCPPHAADGECRVEIRKNPPPRRRPTARVFELLAHSVLDEVVWARTQPDPSNPNPSYTSGLNALLQQAEPTCDLACPEPCPDPWPQLGAIEEQLLFRLGLAGFFDLHQCLDDRSEASFHPYVEALATRSSDGSTIQVVLFNIDPERAADLHLEFEGLTKTPAIGQLALLAPRADLPLQEALAVTLDPAVPAGRVPFQLRCDDSSEYALRKLLPGFAACSSGQDAVETRTIAFCSHPDDDCPDDGIVETQSTLQLSGPSIDLTMPPASIGVLTLTLDGVIFADGFESGDTARWD